ncbi:hypothetical protein ACQ4M3_24395 [Leptolyngbya sp. AN03gr2]|uniref:hypothetical protein n=1 Tax=unclassified Leptolyngbya TaxID=2650499 RepID=UPI003D311D91
MQAPDQPERSHYRLAKHLFSSTFPDEQFAPQLAEAWCGEFATEKIAQMTTTILTTKSC